MVTPIPINLSEVDEIRFWEKVDKRGPDDCWEWNACRTCDGYGQFYIDRRAFYAHRVTFVVTNGDTKLQVCHTCNNPSCCNPKHLYAGTQRDNMSQCVIDDRHEPSRGENSGNAKLTESDVREIRMLRTEGRLLREIADEFGISDSHVSHLYSGRRWAHLKP